MMPWKSDAYMPENATDHARFDRRTRHESAPPSQSSASPVSTSALLE
jgi:hypothetical protein